MSTDGLLASPAPSTEPNTAASHAPPVLRRRWYGDAVGSGALLSVTVVVALWLHDGGVRDLGGGTASALSSAGRLLGLVASDLLLVQCLLMARLPWAERAFGQDRLARWHRVVGFTSFAALVAHIVTITLGYAAGDSRGVLGQAWDLVTTYPGMLLAAAGTALIVMVTLTSIRAARRRMRYESWHLLHLYAYLGLALALPHQVWTGADFVSSPWARAYWWSLWGSAAAAIALFRFAMPLGRSVRHGLRVAHVITQAPGVVSVVLTGRRLDRLPMEGGQFLTLRFLDGPGWSRANPYSLSAAPQPPWLRVTVAAVGEGSARLAHLRPGTRALFEGPHGRMTLSARAEGARPVVLLAAGVGITPMRAVLDELAARESTTLQRTTVVYRARDEQALLFSSEFEAFRTTHGMTLWHLLGPRAERESWLPAQYARWSDADALRHLAPDIAAADVYVCGPPAWATAAIAAARRAGAPASRIHREDFSW